MTGGGQQLHLIAQLAVGTGDKDIHNTKGICVSARTARARSLSLRIIRSAGTCQSIPRAGSASWMPESASGW